ncbi:pentatricopeptide repeat-containing protein At1g31790 [Arachis ipaensis]|uniref:pentatricopeptide repeat-containing protein At1g31790 n=1 Tax=Arachis ipaensis TaxID=130454 RepID=UPI0007AF0B5A|nr:pentatricopeptide repeat-containing protein At1g31790 [Arachis ipaensis]
MELVTVPPPTATQSSYHHHRGSSISTITYSPHNPKLKLPLLHTSPVISSKPLQPIISPQTTTTCSDSIKRRKKKKKKNGSSTLDILCLMEALYNPIPIDIYTSLVKECTVSGDPHTAIHLNNHITHSGIKPPLPFINRILIMLVSCGLLDNARHVFDLMSVRDFNTWATLFVAYYDNADYAEVARVFVSMVEDLGMEDSEFPAWMWGCLLKSCACSANFHLGMQAHGWLLKLGACTDVVLSSSLISFYGKFKHLEDANAVFNHASRHNNMTWSAKIVGGCREKQFSEVFCDFKEMGRQGVKKDSFTFSSVLKACGKMLNREQCGKQVHANAIKFGMVSDKYVKCSLIAMYGRSGLLRDAEQVFEMKGNERNVDCWNAMVMGYMHNGMHIEALRFLYQMKEAGMQPQEDLLNEVRIACGSVKY